MRSSARQRSSPARVGRLRRVAEPRADRALRRPAASRQALLGAERCPAVGRKTPLEFEPTDHTARNSVERVRSRTEMQNPKRTRLARIAAEGRHRRAIRLGPGVSRDFRRIQTTTGWRDPRIEQTLDEVDAPFSIESGLRSICPHMTRFRRRLTTHRRSGCARHQQAGPRTCDGIITITVAVLGNVKAKSPSAAFIDLHVAWILDAASVLFGVGMLMVLTARMAEKDRSRRQQTSTCLIRTMPGSYGPPLSSSS